MNKKTRMVAAILLTVFLTACASAGGTLRPAAGNEPAAEGPAPVKTGGMTGGGELLFATGSDQGTYYSFGNILAETVGEATETSVKPVTSGGSRDNIKALEDRMVDIAFCQSDIMAYAYGGTRLYQEPAGDLSAVAYLYIEPLQIVAADPSVRTVEDLRGRNVSVGTSGSGGYYNALDVLESYGMTEADIHPFYQTFGDSFEAMKEGRIDAAFIVAGAPTAAVKKLSGSRPVNLIGLDEAHADSLHGLCPYYRKMIIPKETYPGMTQDTTTIAVSAVVLARDDVPEADVYNFLYGIFENEERIAALHEKGGELDLRFAASASVVPYHPGAAKYFEEKGIPVRTK